MNSFLKKHIKVGDIIKFVYDNGEEANLFLVVDKHIIGRQEISIKLYSLFYDKIIISKKTITGYKGYTFKGYTKSSDHNYMAIIDMIEKGNFEVVCRVV